MNYEDDMYIDEQALDVEWLEQGRLALKYGRHWAACNDKVLRAQEKLKFIQAQLIKKAQGDPDKYLGRGNKATVVAVEAFYVTHPDHIQAKEDLLDAQFEANIAEMAKNEISYTRKAALENLVKLHGQQYFSGPTIPHNLTEQREIKSKNINKNVKIGMQRRRNDT